jgi:glyoxylase-like metal-dependent hydrolase (beta-lactamase superfamily II)
MPRIFDLSDYSERLESVSLIVGEGLCSNMYVIGSKNVLVVDTGVGNYANPVWPQLEKLGVTADKVRGVALTHAHHDHAMGAFIILERADPKVYVHRLDARHIASYLGPNLVKVEDGDNIPTEIWPLEVVWTPGHTEGGMCLYARREKILFSGDTVFPDGLYGAYYGESGSLEAMVDSLRRLSELEIDIMLPGHGWPVFDGAGDHIKLSHRKASGQA